MKPAILLVLLGLAAWLAAAAPQSKKSVSKKPAAKTTARKASKPARSTALKSASKKVGTVKAKSAASAKKGKAPVQRARGQMQPTAERYREIQQALADRGYLKSEINGKWDAESMEALRRFQQDQNLETSGKIDSLSLIALGLGPRRIAGAPQRPQ